MSIAKKQPWKAQFDHNLSAVKRQGKGSGPNSERKHKSMGEQTSAQPQRSTLRERPVIYV